MVCIGPFQVADLFVSSGRYARIRPAVFTLQILSKPPSPPPFEVGVNTVVSPHIPNPGNWRTNWSGLILCFLTKCQSAGFLDITPPLLEVDALDEEVLALGDAWDKDADFPFLPISSLSAPPTPLTTGECMIGMLTLLCMVAKLSKVSLEAQFGKQLKK